MITGPDVATLGDFEAILDLVDACFTGERDQGGMRHRWGHCYVPTEAGMEQFLVMRDNGRPVSAVEAVDQTVRVGGERLRIAGLTAVATHPDYRGRGLMTALLKAWMPRLRDLGYALSDLGGDRVRYGRFGWENGPADWEFTIHGRSLATEQALPGWEVGKVPAAGAVEKVYPVYDADGFGAARDLEAMKRLLERGGTETWVATEEDGGTAYLVCYPGDDGGRRVVEFGGPEAGVDAIVRHLKKACGAPRLTVRCPRTHPMLSYFFRTSDRWALTSARMTKIVDLEKTLRGFGAQLKKRFESLGLKEKRSFSLAVEGAGTGAVLQIASDTVEVESLPAAEAALLVSDRDAVRLLFTDDTLRLVDVYGTVPGWFSALLPLDYFLWPLERV